MKRLLRRLAWWYIQREPPVEFPGEVDVFAAYYADEYATPRPKA